MVIQVNVVSLSELSGSNLTAPVASFFFAFEGVFSTVLDVFLENRAK